MTIIGLFRRYKRWNPVHPTYGAFWGLGIGAGCGVGWGPGFGPESVGFVGGGCGLGFSIGVTFVGFGIGLPASGLTSLPFNALSCATCEAFQFAKSSAPAVVGATNKGLRSISICAVDMQRNLAKDIQSSNLTTISTLAEANIKQTWRAIEKNILDVEQKLCQIRSQALLSLKMVSDKGVSGDSR